MFNTKAIPNKINLTPSSNDGLLKSPSRMFNTTKLTSITVVSFVFIIFSGCGILYLVGGLLPLCLGLTSFLVLLTVSQLLEKELLFEVSLLLFQPLFAPPFYTSIILRIV